MPIFEYRCPVCGHIFEKLILGRNQEAPACPKCGSARTDQKFSTFATTGAAPRSSGPVCAPTGGA